MPNLLKDYARRSSMTDNSDRAYMADRIREVTDNLPPNPLAPQTLRMEIRDGDTPSWDVGKGNERVEQQGGSIFANGGAYTIEADVQIEGVPISNIDRWYIAPWQLHGNDSGQPFLSMEIVGNLRRLRAGVHQGGKNLITWTMEPGRWHREAVRFRLAGSETGFVELWIDGVLVKRFDNIRTGTGGAAYLKRGQYRSADKNGTGVINVNGLRVLDGSVAPYDTTTPPPTSPVDVVGPALTVRMPTPDAVIRGVLEYAITTSDPSGIASVAYSLVPVSGGAPIPVKTERSAPFDDSSTLEPYASTAVPDGAYLFRVASTDKAGNATTLDTRVIVDNVQDPPPPPDIPGDPCAAIVAERDMLRAVVAQANADLQGAREGRDQALERIKRGIEALGAVA